MTAISALVTVRADVLERRGFGAFVKYGGPELQDVKKLPGGQRKLVHVDNLNGLAMPRTTASSGRAIERDRESRGHHEDIHQFASDVLLADSWHAKGNVEKQRKALEAAKKSPFRALGVGRLANRRFDKANAEYTRVSSLQQQHEGKVVELQKPRAVGGDYGNIGLPDMSAKEEGKFRTYVEDRMHPRYVHQHLVDAARSNAGSARREAKDAHAKLRATDLDPRERARLEDHVARLKITGEENEALAKAHSQAKLEASRQDPDPLSYGLNHRASWFDPSRIARPH